MSTRRTFISESLGVAVLGGALPLSFVRAAGAQPLAGTGADPDAVLVVVQMAGGNDGLNTVVPYSDDNYHRVRPTLALAEGGVIRLDDRIGLNPALAPLAELYREGHVALVQGVGYPNPNRSHFEATQIWETASPQRPTNIGWLGRYLDATVASRPAGGLRNVPIDFTGVALGDQIPTALLAAHVDVPAIGDLAGFEYRGGATAKPSAGALFNGATPGQSPYLALIEQTSRAAFFGGDVLRAKVADYRPLVTYPKDAFARQLEIAARIVGSRIGTRVIFVSIGSFDTHVGQRAQQDRLLGALAGGLAAFYKDLAAHGNAERVLAMTFSEFGRRVQQNASNGTDHGTAMPLFVIGGRIKGGIYGEHPSLTDLEDGDLKFHTDFRQVYATVLARWLGRDPQPILGGAYDELPFA
jgi:uncharacterized protein (DUF1501 family)